MLIAPENHDPLQSLGAELIGYAAGSQICLYILHDWPHSFALIGISFLVRALLIQSAHGRVKPVSPPTKMKVGFDSLTVAFQWKYMNQRVCMKKVERDSYSSDERE
ncbi:hypothetical protein AB990_17410 [Alkalihalobacillus pseudalcaliphilus]|nr:hypothetical protein AB990_17410 [Alkalihalobacillus pseudalcaliphilus]